jgi:hypothetical protein
MVNRKGVFIGAYVPSDLKKRLKQRASSEHRTLSQEITLILERAVQGQGLPPGVFQDRRSPGSRPRRRDADPLPRRRKDDVAAPDSRKK